MRFEIRPARLGAALAALIAVAGLAACSRTVDGKLSAQAGASTSVLESTLLRASDLPSGWTAKQASSSGSSSADDTQSRELAACLGVTVNPAVAAAQDAHRVQSPQFTLGPEQVGSESEPNLEPTSSAQRRAILSSPRANSCITSSLRSSLQSKLTGGAQLDNVTATITGAKPGQPSNVTYVLSAQVTVTAQGQQAPIYFTQVGIESSTVRASVNCESELAPVPADVEAGAVKAVSQRVART